MNALPKLPQPRRQWSAKRFVLRGLAVVALVAAVFLYRDQSGQPTGGACQSDGDCKGLFSGKCMREGSRGYCSHSCKSDADCEGGLECGRVRWTDVKAGKKNEMTVCIPGVVRYDIHPDAVVGGVDGGSSAVGMPGWFGTAAERCVMRSAVNRPMR